MAKSEVKFAQVRLEVLVNRKRRAMLGVEAGEKLLAGVTHMHVEQIGLLRTALKMFNVDADRSHDGFGISKATQSRLLADPHLRV